MTEFSSSKDELLASLKTYTSLLQARNEALTRISNTSDEIRATLRRDSMPDINEALHRREQDCALYSTVWRHNEAEEQAMIDNAIAAAQSANDELASIAKSVIALHEDSRSLAEKVLNCQNECETLMKARLQAVSKALCESNQRRKLDAAYGPACKHDTPMFVDKQQ